MADAQRLDVALVTRGLVESRERAQEAIKAEMVLVNGKVGKKSAEKVAAADHLEVTGDPIGFVSRGGLKLQGALDAFGIDPAGHVCLDVGASTGGFTHCLLNRGAAYVYSVDVGHDQLHPTMASDPRVANLEGTDIRKLERLPPCPVRPGVPPDLCVVDVSFISLTMVLPGILPHLARPARLAVLVKPQFEVGPDRLGKGGIVRSEKDREQAVAKVRAACTEHGLRPGRHIPSPVLGTAGNQEFLLEIDYPAAGVQPAAGFLRSKQCGVRREARNGAYACDGRPHGGVVADHGPGRGLRPRPDASGRAAPGGPRAAPGSHGAVGD